MNLIGSLMKPAAYIGVPLYALHKASEVSPITRYYVRLGLYVSTLGLVSAWGVVVAIGMRLAGHQLDVNYVVARSFHLIAGRVLGITFEVEGEEHVEKAGAAVLVGNHQSMLDVLYLGRIFPRQASIMAKKELQWTPLLGQYMTFSGAVFVDRGNNARAVSSLRAAAERMRRESMALWMFPEGTRSMREQADMLPFKKGAFHLAIQGGLPVVPVVCENYWRLYHKGVFNSGVLRIRVLKPIPTADLTTEDVGALANRVRDAMLVALREISESRSVTSARDRTPRPPSPKDETKTVVEQSVSPAPVMKDSRPESPASSTYSIPSKRELGNASGAETEEDEGMVLVGRPPV